MPDLTRLATTAKELVVPTKGILAVDESPKTLGRRFHDAGIKDSTEAQRAFRELLLTTERIEDHLSGVILYKDTAIQRAPDGRYFPEYLFDSTQNRNILSGVKVDSGTAALPHAAGELLTQGLHELRDECIWTLWEKLGVRFTKWRALFRIGNATPSPFAIRVNATQLALFAATSQDHHMVPIVEPEILMDGSHSADRCAEATKQVLNVVFESIDLANVQTNCLLLKTHMILPGKDAPHAISPEECAQRTVECIGPILPKGLAGVLFLSGGQTAQDASIRLNAIAKLSPRFVFSFSFARALHQECLRSWASAPADQANAQHIFLEQLTRVAAARQGRLP